MIAIDEYMNLNDLPVEQLVGNLQTFEANHYSDKKSKGIALMSSKDNADDESDNDSDDAELEALFVKKFKKYLNKNKKNLKREFSKNKILNKLKIGSKNEKTSSKNTNKPIQCFECQGFGHPASKCANQLERNKGKTLNVSWEEDSEDENSESESQSKYAKFVAFMSSTNLSFEQGSSDKDFKSNDESRCEDLSDEEQDLEVVYKKLLKDSLCLTRINDKLSHKLKVSESQNSSFSFELDDARAKVSQLENPTCNSI